MYTLGVDDYSLKMINWQSDFGLNNNKRCHAETTRLSVGQHRKQWVVYNWLWAHTSRVTWNIVDFITKPPKKIPNVIFYDQFTNKVNNIWYDLLPSVTVSGIISLPVCTKKKTNIPANNRKIKMCIYLECCSVCLYCCVLVLILATWIL